MGLSVSMAQAVELYTHVLSGIAINIIPDKELKYRTATLGAR